MCLIGLGNGEARFRVADVFQKQMTLLTSWTMSIVQQRQCAEFIVRNKLPVDNLFTHRWNLDQIHEAYHEFDKQSAGKGAVVFDDAS